MLIQWWGKGNTVNDYRGHSSSFTSGPGTGSFMQQKIVSSTKIGPDGRPIQESYQTKTNGVYTGKRNPEILERKQMYKNTGTGLEKAGVERMYQGKGRKVVYEKDRSSGANNSYNYYKGIRENDAQDFDREWENAAERFGLGSGVKALPYGSGAAKVYKRSRTDENYGGAYMDEGRRGYYVSDRLKGSNMPVNVPTDLPQNIERLRPAETGHRLDVPNNRETGGASGLALPSNENRAQANRATVRNQYGGNINARAPNRRGKQARIG